MKRKRRTRILGKSQQVVSFLDKLQPGWRAEALRQFAVKHPRVTSRILTNIGSLANTYLEWLDLIRVQPGYASGALFVALEFRKWKRY